MIEMAKCRCGAWLSIVILEYGATAEVCTVCRYRQPLRSRVMTDELVTLSLEERRTEITRKVCAWPGCGQFASSHRTDLCAPHCTERRLRLNREYARAKADLVRTRAHVERPRARHASAKHAGMGTSGAEERTHGPL